MTVLEIAMAGYLAFGQPTGNYYEAITKHSGLQVIHADGAVTLRLSELGVRSCELGVDGSKTTVIRLRDERYPFEVTRYVRTWDDCAAVETWAEIRHEERGTVKLLRADSFAAPVAVKSETVRVMSLTGIAKNEANVSETALANGQTLELVSSAGTRNAWEANAAMMVEFGDGVDEERGKVLGVALADVLQYAVDGLADAVLAGTGLSHQAVHEGGLVQHVVDVAEVRAPQVCAQCGEHGMRHGGLVDVGSLADKKSY